MIELRSQINVRVNGEVNVTFEMTHLVEDENEARDAGVMSKKMFDAWVDGYGTTEQAA